jgi:serine/threonine-protein kinase
MDGSRPSIQGRAARYEPLFKLASGGMATVYVGRLVGAMGFQRLVAIKRPHRHLLEDPRLVQMLLYEATLASKLQHPNVVSVQDVVQIDDLVYLIMDLIEGASLSELVRASNEQSVPIPRETSIRILLDTSAGLHAAHELSDDDGTSMGLVHRDVSPHNVLVGVDGVARVTDFGIAKCVNVKGKDTTTTGTLKGKYAYMAPEYIQGRTVDRRADIFSLGVVAWELLAGRRLFLGDSPPATMMSVVREPAPPLSDATDAFGKVLDDVLAQALAKDPSDRFDTVQAFANALESSARAASSVAPASDVGTIVRSLHGEALEKRKRQLKRTLEDLSRVDRPTDPLPKHMAALDQAPSVHGSTVQVTERLPPVDAASEPSRIPILPGSDPSEISLDRALPPRRRFLGAWVAGLVAALASIAIVAFALGRSHVDPAPSPDASITRVDTIAVASSSALPSASASATSAPSSTPAASTKGLPTATVRPLRSAQPRSEPVPAAEPTDTAVSPERTPPPNPYR